MLESSLDLKILGFFFSWRVWAIFPKESFAKVTVDFLLWPRGKKFNTSKNATMSIGFWIHVKTNCFQSPKTMKLTYATKDLITLVPHNANHERNYVPTSLYKHKSSLICKSCFGTKTIPTLAFCLETNTNTSTHISPISVPKNLNPNGTIVQGKMRSNLFGWSFDQKAANVENINKGTNYRSCNIGTL
jgi:hypothetical protein